MENFATIVNSNMPLDINPTLSIAVVCRGFWLHCLCNFIRYCIATIMSFSNRGKSLPKTNLLKMYSKMFHPVGNSIKIISSLVCFYLLIVCLFIFCLIVSLYFSFFSNSNLTESFIIFNQN